MRPDASFRRGVSGGCAVAHLRREMPAGSRRGLSAQQPHDDGPTRLMASRPPCNAIRLCVERHAPSTLRVRAAIPKIRRLPCRGSSHGCGLCDLGVGLARRRGLGLGQIGRRRVSRPRLMKPTSGFSRTTMRTSSVLSPYLVTPSQTMATEAEPPRAPERVAP